MTDTSRNRVKSRSKSQSTTASKAASPIAPATQQAPGHLAHQDCEPCDSLPAAFARQLRYDLNRNERRPQELYQALALSVKEQLLDDWCASRSQDALYQRKQVAYLSLEFLMGRSWATPCSIWT